MSDRKLQADLERLRAELNRVAKNDAETRGKLNGIINDLERRLKHPGDESLHRNLLSDIRDTISQFEAEHPRATAILNDIMVTLSNLGI
ncbi:MAG: DUF4404 family protein [Gammaproteobacteria bacterium]|nr:DUF4404 family protein [Gammaproteobacteria bacterium]